jgi:hypothetical protein
MSEQKCPGGTAFQRSADAVRRNQLIAILIIFALSSFPALHGIASAAEAANESSPITIKTHFEGPPDHFELMPPCVAWNSVPKEGTCRGTGRNSKPTAFTGDWQGHSEFAYGFLILPSGLAYNGGVDHFTGIVAGCGTGSMYFQQQEISDSKGNFQGQWQIIEGIGTNELAGVRGSGKYSGVTRTDGSSTGDFSGTMYCLSKQVRR